MSIKINGKRYHLKERVEKNIRKFSAFVFISLNFLLVNYWLFKDFKTSVMLTRMYVLSIVVLYSALKIISFTLGKIAFIFNDQIKEKVEKAKSFVDYQTL